MEQIKIGTCVPAKSGRMAARYAGRRLECFEVNFHMSYEGYDLPKLAETVKRIVDGRPVNEPHWGITATPSRTRITLKT